MIKVEGNETIKKKTKTKQSQAWKGLPHYKQGNRLPQDAKIVPYYHLMLSSSIQLLGFLGGMLFFSFFLLNETFPVSVFPHPCYCSVPALSFLPSPCHVCKSNPCQVGQRQMLCPCGSPTAAFLRYCLASNPLGCLSRICPQQLCKESSSQLKSQSLVQMAPVNSVKVCPHPFSKGSAAHWGISCPTFKVSCQFRDFFIASQGVFKTFGARERGFFLCRLLECSVLGRWSSICYSSTDSMVAGRLQAGVIALVFY